MGAVRRTHVSYLVQQAVAAPRQLLQVVEGDVVHVHLQNWRRPRRRDGEILLRAGGDLVHGLEDAQAGVHGAVMLRDQETRQHVLPLCWGG